MQRALRVTITTGAGSCGVTGIGNRIPRVSFSTTGESSKVQCQFYSPEPRSYPSPVVVPSRSKLVFMTLEENTKTIYAVAQTDNNV